ncbi:hypothetical protein [Actinoplanes sp. HUAS TT8]|uniref:hypothetical protein n=1 Tax=Actinoplanes sp. HUAS TT8 TaxID=3447453 RepID=UPI003F520BFB
MSEPLSRTELLALLEFLPLHHAEDLPEQPPYDHLKTLLIGLSENFDEGTDELAFFLDVDPADLADQLGDHWIRVVDEPVRDKSRLWYFDDDRLTIGIGPEDVIIGTATGHHPDHRVACLPRALTPELVEVAVSARISGQT